MLELRKVSNSPSATCTPLSGISSTEEHLYRLVFRSLHINSMHNLNRLEPIHLTPLNPNNRRTQPLRPETPKLEGTDTLREYFIQLLQSAILHLGQDKGHPDSSNDREGSVHEPDFTLEIPVTLILHVGVDEGYEDADGEAAEGADCDCLLAELEGWGFCCYDPDAGGRLVRGWLCGNIQEAYQEDHPKACANCQIKRQASAPLMLSGLLS
jgi:hypothetical protein